MKVVTFNFHKMQCCVTISISYSQVGSHTGALDYFGSLVDICAIAMAARLHKPEIKLGLAHLEKNQSIVFLSLLLAID